MKRFAGTACLLGPVRMKSALFLLCLGLFPGVAAAQTYGAIAYSQSTGKYGYSYKYDTRAEAEESAMSNCKGSDSEVVVWAKDGWCALALDSDGDAYGWGWSDSPEVAKAKALAGCRKHTEHCYLALRVSTDGDVEEFDPPPTPPKLTGKPKDGADKVARNKYEIELGDAPKAPSPLPPIPLIKP